MLASLTDLGDSALLLPASLALVLYLMGSGWRRAGLAFAAAVGLCVALTFAVKLGFQYCSGEAPSYGIHSPSGHSALAAAFYGSSAILFGIGRARWLRGTMLVAAFLFAGAIAWSRVRLQAHTVPEIAIGLAVGFGALVCFNLLRRGERPPAPLPPLPVLAVLAVLVMTVHDHHIEAEGLIARIARMLEETSGLQCRPASVPIASAWPLG